MAAPTPTPWSVKEDGGSIWIEGPEGSAATDRLPADRRIVCDFRLYGDDALDAETRANFARIADLANLDAQGVAR